MIDNNGKLITNYHVIEGAYSAKVTLGGKEYTVNKVLAYDQAIDIAVIQISASDLPVSTLCDSTHVQFGGYIFTGVMPSEVNTLFEIVKIITPLGLWCVANWCFTSLMDGKGTMKDIYIATAYSLRPYIITGIPLWLISRCLVEDEAFIYTTLSTIVIIWMLALIFFSMMITHDYSLSKAVVVTVLTLVGICLILFLALTFSNIVQRIYDFAMDLYREFIYRTY